MYRWITLVVGLSWGIIWCQATWSGSTPVPPCLLLPVWYSLRYLWHGLLHGSFALHVALCSCHPWLLRLIMVWCYVEVLCCLVEWSMQHFGWTMNGCGQCMDRCFPSSCYPCALLFHHKCLVGSSALVGRLMFLLCPDVTWSSPLSLCSPAPHYHLHVHSPI